MHGISISEDAKLILDWSSFKFDIVRMVIIKNRHVLMCTSPAKYLLISNFKWLSIVAEKFFYGLHLIFEYEVKQWISFVIALKIPVSCQFTVVNMFHHFCAHTVNRSIFWLCYILSLFILLLVVIIYCCTYYYLLYIFVLFIIIHVFIEFINFLLVIFIHFNLILLINCICS